MKIATSGDILKIFKSEDGETILRTTNIRTFTKQNNIKYHIVGQIWAIDFEDFMSKINPYKNLNHYPIPRIRTIASSFKEFNKTHKTQINGRKMFGKKQKNTLYKVWQNLAYQLWYIRKRDY